MAAKSKDKNRQHKRDRFLSAFSECGNISEAARISKCNRTLHYEWLEDPEYVKQFQDAKEQAIEQLELVARTRATLSSDLLLIFLLKSLRPETYKDRREIENKGLPPVNVKIFQQYIQLKEQAKKELDSDSSNRLKEHLN